MPNLFFILFFLQLHLFIIASADPRHVIVDVFNQSVAQPELIFTITEYRIPAEFTKLRDIGPSNLAECESRMHTIHATIKNDKKSRLLFRTNFLPDPTRTISIVNANDPTKTVLYKIEETPGNANYKKIMLLGEKTRTPKPFFKKTPQRIMTGCSLFGFLSKRKN